MESCVKRSFRDWVTIRRSAKPENVNFCSRNQEGVFQRCCISEALVYYFSH